MIDPKIRAIYYTMLKEDPTEIWKSDREAYEKGWRTYLYNQFEKPMMIDTILELLISKFWYGEKK